MPRRARQRPDGVRQDVRICGCGRSRADTERVGPQHPQNLAESAGTGAHKEGGQHRCGSLGPARVVALFDVRERDLDVSWKLEYGHRFTHGGGEAHRDIGVELRKVRGDLVVVPIAAATLLRDPLILKTWLAPRCSLLRKAAIPLPSSMHSRPLSVIQTRMWAA